MKIIDFLIDHEPLAATLYYTFASACIARGSYYLFHLDFRQSMGVFIICMGLASFRQGWRM